MDEPAESAQLMDYASWCHHLHITPQHPPPFSSPFLLYGPTLSLQHYLMLFYFRQQILGQLPRKTAPAQFDQFILELTQKIFDVSNTYLPDVFESVMRDIQTMLQLDRFQVGHALPFRKYFQYFSLQSRLNTEFHSALTLIFAENLIDFFFQMDTELSRHLLNKTSIESFIQEIKGRECAPDKQQTYQRILDLAALMLEMNIVVVDLDQNKEYGNTMAGDRAETIRLAIMQDKLVLLLEENQASDLVDYKKREAITHSGEKTKRNEGRVRRTQSINQPMTIQPYAPNNYTTQCAMNHGIDTLFTTMSSNNTHLETMALKTSKLRSNSQNPQRRTAFLKQEPRRTSFLKETSHNQQLVLAPCYSQPSPVNQYPSGPLTNLSYRVY